jgi:hypothetical protein
MIRSLRDRHEDAEIEAAEFAVEMAKERYAKLHIAAAARIVRLAFPDAMSLVVDAGLACGQPDSCELELVTVADRDGRPLWTSESPPPATAAPWADVLNAVTAHLAVSFNESGAFGWDRVIGGGLDTYSIALPEAPSGQTPSTQQRSPTSWS